MVRAVQTSDAGQGVEIKIMTLELQQSSVVSDCQVLTCSLKFILQCSRLELALRSL